MLAKPWQRVVVGVALAVVGALLGIYIVSAIGAVLVILVVLGWFRRRRGPGASEPSDGVVPADADVTGD
jgi:O-antigen/teichoic acid export membrane protein